MSSLKKRVSSLLIPTLVIAVLVHEIWTTPVYTDRELASMREAAVALARQGDIETALEKLRALSEVAPRDRTIWGDYLTVLVRARRDDEALALYRSNAARPLPDYALAELFDAALRAGDIDLARAIADREIAQSRDRDKVAAARASALAAVTSAREPAAPATELLAQTDNSRQAAAAAAVPSEQPSAAAVSTSGVSAVRPARARAATVRAHASPLAAASARPIEPVAARDKCAHCDDAATLAERARGAVQRAESAPAAERVSAAEAAVPVVQAYEAMLPEGSVALRNARLDRVRALTLANRLDEAATVFESTGAAEQLPLYGILNGADLYTRRHEPERARALLDIGAAQFPDSRDLLIARYYNQLDLEQFDRASQTVAQLREISPAAATRRDTEIMSAMLAAYQNRLAEAQRQLESLQRAEPDKADIHMKLAQIYRWRGWPRRALAEYRAAAAHASDAVPARVGETAALNDLHAFTQARAQLQQLAEAAPAHPDVVQAQQAQMSRQRWDYSAQVLTGQSSGGPVTTGGDFAFEQKLYSPPQAEQYRAFVHQRYDWADFPEGTGSADRLGVGADFRSPSFDIAAELGDRIPGGRIGATLSGEWKVDDRFSAFGEIQTDSTQVPLRALHAGIDGHSAAVGALYRADESRSLRASFSRADFSDANRRNTFLAEYQQSVYRDARQQVIAVAQGYYSDNSAGSGVPYFNPDSETSLGLGAIYEGTLWHRYERRWSQRVQLGLSNYTQQHFGSGAIWDAQYEQRWQVSNQFSFNYGALYRSRLYDGNREGYTAVFGGVNWRF